MRRRRRPTTAKRALCFFFSHPKPFDLAFHPLQKQNEHKKQQYLYENPGAKTRRQSRSGRESRSSFFSSRGNGSDVNRLRTRRQRRPCCHLFPPRPRRAARARAPRVAGLPRDALDIGRCGKAPEEDPGQDRGAGGGAGGGRAAAAAAAAAVKARGLRPQPASARRDPAAVGPRGARRRKRGSRSRSRCSSSSGSGSRRRGLAKGRRRRRRHCPRRLAAAQGLWRRRSRGRRSAAATAAASPSASASTCSAPDTGGPTTALGDCAAEEAEDGRGGRRRRRGGRGRRVGPRARTRRLRGPGAFPCCRCR